MHDHAFAFNEPFISVRRGCGCVCWLFVCFLCMAVHLNITRRRRWHLLALEMTLRSKVRP